MMTKHQIVSTSEFHLTVQENLFTLYPYFHIHIYFRIDADTVTIKYIPQ